MGADPELRKQYRATWEAFSQMLDRYQACVDSGDRSRAEAALLDVEKARMVHNAARDRLAQQLTGEIAALDMKAIGVAEQRRVRETAHILWEIAGKPSGTAESDWRRAETLVRTASAAC
jgi:hypothetical protein